MLFNCHRNHLCTLPFSSDGSCPKAAVGAGASPFGGVCDESRKVSVNREFGVYGTIQTGAHTLGHRYVWHYCHRQHHHRRRCCQQLLKQQPGLAQTPNRQRPVPRWSQAAHSPFSSDDFRKTILLLSTIRLPDEQNMTEFIIILQTTNMMSINLLTVTNQLCSDGHSSKLILI